MILLDRNVCSVQLALLARCGWKENGEPAWIRTFLSSTIPVSLLQELLTQSPGVACWQAESSSPQEGSFKYASFIA